MTSEIQLYNRIKEVVNWFVTRLKLEQQVIQKTGRKRILPLVHSITLGLFKQKNNIATKKAVYEIMEPPCSYKTMVMSMNQFAKYGLVILALILKANKKNAHLIKHTDSTDLPVCLNKNAKYHKTMQGFADWGKTGKGWFYGLKLHLTTDLRKKILSIQFTSGNTHDASMFVKLNKGLYGVFVADAAYAGDKLATEFYEEYKRILFAKPRKNMKKLMTVWQDFLYQTRMMIEINFKNVKQLYGLVTSFPRSVNGYLAHYTYSLLACVLA